MSTCPLSVRHPNAAHALVNAMAACSLLITVALLNPYTVLLAQSPVPAYTLNQYTVEPAYQEVVLGERTAEASASVTVRNTTGQATTFEVYALEFPNVDHFGSLQFVDFSQAELSAKQAPYIHFDAQQFVLEPHHQRAVALRITDRAELKPGGTYTAVVIRSQAQIRAGQQVVVPALTSQLLIRKQHGEIRNLSLTDVSGDPTALGLWVPKRVALHFSNNGNVHLLPRGTVTITDLFNRTVAKGIINDASHYVLPSRNRSILVDLQRIRWTLPISVLTIWVDGGAETTHYQYESTFVYISPWLAVLALGSIWVVRRLRRRTQKPHRI